MPINEDHINLLSEILLNKVKGWQWYYYDVSLSRIELEAHDSLVSGPSTVSLKDPATPIVNLDTLPDDGTPITEQISRLRKLISNPDATEVFATVLHHVGHPPEVLEKVVRRIFDLNKINGYLLANQGMLGKFNERDRTIRNELFMKRLKKTGRSNLKVILAEGDSWLQFPRVYFNYDPVKDIVDCLNKNKGYAVYSQAYGGDWLSNILFLQEYVEELPRLSPDVFLISGGGNDLVGNFRLATMVENPFANEKKGNSEKVDNPAISNYLKKYAPRYQRLLEKRTIMYEGLPRGSKSKLFFDPLKYKRGLAHVRDEFFQFINVVMVQYFLFIKNIRDTGQYDEMKIITHGYDFVIPKRTESKESSFRLLRQVFNGKTKTIRLNPFRQIINKFNDNGNWLSVPLQLKGITDQETKEAILYFMIFEFNEMLIQLASYSGFPNLYHIDMRHLANDEDRDWYDELHLTSKAYRRAGWLFEKCIDANNGNGKKIYTVDDLKQDKFERD